MSESKMKFRARYLDLTDNSKIEHDFELVVDMLKDLEDEGWELNENLYHFLVDGFRVNRDNTRMVMLLGVYPGGTEDLISNPLVAGQLGADIPPMFHSLLRKADESGE